MEWGLNKKERERLDKEVDKIEGEFHEGRKIEDFTALVRDDFKVKLPDNYSINDDFANRFEKNEGIWKIVEGCKKQYRVGLLTNMYLGLLDSIKKHGKLPNINWDVVVDSSLEKFQKPREEIYLIAQKKAGVEANEILFVDNLQKNLEIPKKLGWKTFLYNSEDYEKANKELEEFLNLPPNPLL